MCMVADPTATTTTFIVSACPAKELDPEQRQQLALAALAGTQSISVLAAFHQVSRKFVYQTAAKAEQALHLAFDPDKGPIGDDRVLFYLPVTKAWLRQLVLALVFVCHSSFRAVVELLGDLFDYRLSLGSVYNIVHRAVPLAAEYNRRQDLADVRIGALDEIFQAGSPILVGCDADSTFCFLLSLEECRDGDTWGVRLLECVDRGFDPDATIGDGGRGLRAGHQEALPGVPCRGDVFHGLYEVKPLVRHLESRAYEAIATRTKLETQLKRPGKWRDRRKLSLVQKLRHARTAEGQAIALTDDVTVLWDWLREDVLAVAGANHADRCALYDFVVGELRVRQTLCPHRLGPVVTLLLNQRDNLLAFVKQLDSDSRELGG